jgi:S-adenosylmethionine:tRNA ribosyltransferase-isomerase
MTPPLLSPSGEGLAGGLGGPGAGDPAGAEPADGLDFTLPPELEAAEPPEARGTRRDAVRLLVGRRGTGRVSHHAFGELPGLLAPGDVLVVNTSGTLPAAVPAGTDLLVHFSTELPDGRWAVELRRRHPAGPQPTGPQATGPQATGPQATGPQATGPQATGTVPVLDAVPGTRLRLAGGGSVTLAARYTARLWRADVDPAGAPDVPDYLFRHGRPIRYGYVPGSWPLAAYQTVFATTPGSAEMPSAGRPFTAELVTRLVSAGIVVAPVTLHTGVASPEAHEKPYPERYEVPAATARLVTEARRAGARVVAVGTTVVRALETAAGPDGSVVPAAGWTSLVVTPRRGVRVVDGLLTGFHEPRASHLRMLAAIAGRELLARCYAEALAGGYRWHEFGDVNLLLP